MNKVFKSNIFVIVGLFLIYHPNAWSGIEEDLAQLSARAKNRTLEQPGPNEPPTVAILMRIQGATIRARERMLQAQHLGEREPPRGPMVSEYVEEVLAVVNAIIQTESTRPEHERTPPDTTTFFLQFRNWEDVRYNLEIARRTLATMSGAYALAFPVEGTVDNQVGSFLVSFDALISRRGITASVTQSFGILADLLSTHDEAYTNIVIGGLHGYMYSTFADRFSQLLSDQIEAAQRLGRRAGMDPFMVQVPNPDQEFFSAMQTQLGNLRVYVNRAIAVLSRNAQAGNFSLGSPLIPTGTLPRLSGSVGSAM